MSSVNREAQHWERLASDDPMWVILTEDDRRGSWSATDFFESGRVEVSDALTRLRERLDLSPKRGTAVDFGCGLGRLSQALAEHFDHVHGIDISAAMVAQAKSYNRHGEKVTYHANVSDQLDMLDSGSIDFIYSRLTLQHIPTAVAVGYLGEFGRALAPNGIAMVQVLTRARSLAVRLRHQVRNSFPEAYRRLRDLVFPGPRWEMNTMSIDKATRAFARAGAVRLEILDEPSGGTAFESKWLIAVQRG